MKKLLFSLAALMSIATISAQTVQQLYEAAEGSLKAKDLPAAVKGFEQVIDKGMDDDSAAGMVAAAKTYLPQCLFRIGGSYFMKKDYETARKYFTQAADAAELYDDIAMMNKVNAYIGKSYETQGGAAFNAKDYATALPVFEKGYAADPRNVNMANWLGVCYSETGNFDKGMEVFGKVAAMGSNPKYKAAAADAEKNMVLYTNNRVADLQKNKDYNGVITMADALLAKNPKNAIAAKVRLQAYSDKKDYAKVFSLADATAALQSSPEEKSNIYFILGAAYNAKEMKDKAIAAFKKVTSGSNAAAAAATIKELSE